MATDQKLTAEQLKEAEERYTKSRYKEWIWGVAVCIVISIAIFIADKHVSAFGFWVHDMKTTFIGSFFTILLAWFGFIQFWRYNFYRDKENEKKKNPFRKMFFGSINVISLILLAAGIFISFIIMSDGKMFLAIASFITIVWTVVFLRYFMWSVYFYNINYGLTDLDWDKIFERRQANVPENEINAPKKNPYSDQTFGLPGGTVRGMIAFTLLFGGLALLLASMDMKGEISGNSYYADHFEFFKTAFLMMIAFYFGDSSLKYLTKNSKKSDDTEEESKTGSTESGSSSKSGTESKTDSALTTAKKALQTGGKGKSSSDESIFE